jgi:TorA maturation chaperone TorD
MGDRMLRGSTYSAGRLDSLAQQASFSSASAASSSSAPRGRVLSVDAVMDVASAILWPDPDRVQPIEVDESDTARAQEYSLLARLLTRAPDAATLGRLAKLRCGATALGLAHSALARAAEKARAETIEREFFNIFVGLGRGELLPYASYYLTGFLNERPLARLRDDLRALGIERVETQTEPEDHAAVLCEIMAGLTGGQFAISPDEQQQFFEKHVAPWMGRFFTDLESVEGGEFYRHAGAVGRLFLEIEKEAFALPA